MTSSPLAHYSREALQGQREHIEKLEAALRKARHDLWLYAENSADDDGAIRGEVAIRMIDEALAKSGAGQ